MSKYPPMDDLLRNQRRRSRRRGRGPKGLLVLLVLAAAAGGWWWYTHRDVEAEKARVESNVMGEAVAVVDQSVEAARAPLEVKKASEDLGTSKRDEELTATWTEGEEVAMRGVLHKNQSVFVALQDRNVSAGAIHAAVTATSKEFDFRRSRPGDEWFALVNSDGDITRFRYKTSPEDIWETTRTGDGEYMCEKVEVPVQKRAEVIAGTVNSSLWQAMVDQGEDGSLIYRFADIFAYTIDFNTATRPGDRFALVFNKIYIDGKFLRYGKILAGMYVGGDGIFYGFYYHSDDDETGYYDENGENLQRQFLKSPLASVRVTSTFGKRFHPVLHKMKLHNGVDYGAPVGTPIRAVADGKVLWAGWKGANGRLIVLRHANGYKTMYAHLSSIAKGIRRGKRVTKKTIIGRTGNSGRSTGPHLHFGMTHNGRYVNPRKVDFARAEPLKGAEKERYIEEVADPLKDKLDEAMKKSGFSVEAAPPPGVDNQPSVSSN